jgi:hypothetical protein
MYTHKILYEFSKSLKKKINIDLIASFNIKNSNLMDCLVNEVL